MGRLSEEVMKLNRTTDPKLATIRKIVDTFKGEGMLGRRSDLEFLANSIDSLISDLKFLRFELSRTEVMRKCMGEMSFPELHAKLLEELGDLQDWTRITRAKLEDCADRIELEYVWTERQDTFGARVIHGRLSGSLEEYEQLCLEEKRLRMGGSYGLLQHTWRKDSS